MCALHCVIEPKARIEAKGFHHVHGVDYNEKYAYVVSPDTLRIFLDIVAHQDLECPQTNVIRELLNGNLDEEIVMEVPDGLKDSSCPIFVCKLLKALYGLKHAPRQWYAKINS